MKYIQILFSVLLFTTVYGFGADESFENVHLSKREACSFLKSELRSAKKEVFGNEAFREYLISQDITVGPADPAFKFLNNLPLINEVIKIFHDSSVVFEISERFAKRLFQNNLPRSRNINPLLHKYSFCLEDFFAKFCVANEDYKCQKNQKYRRIDGYCNSLYRPKEGAAGTPFVSLLYQNYDDSMTKLRREKRTGDRLPLPRVITTELLENCQSDLYYEDGPSVGGAQFGVFITLDTVALAYPRSFPSLTCCTKNFSTILPKKLLHESCDPIKIPKNDKFFGPRGMTCMNFLRTQSGYDTDCVLSSRQQLNGVTSMLDLSQTYGTFEEIANRGRTFVDGLLKTSADNLLPEDENGNFILTDFRQPATPVAIIYGILFLREHNRIACDLKRQFPNWNDEKLYQEARRWNIAQYQYIVYEWIKIFIPDQYKNLRLTKDKNTKVTGATTNEFGHAAFRVHHSLISETVQLFDEDGEMFQETALSDSDAVAFMKNFYADVARSLFYQKLNLNGCHNEIRNVLFKNSAGVGMDLLSFDLKRGRDHGLQPFHKYVELCLDKKINSFSDLECVFSKKNLKKLKDRYDSFEDIDLYIGLHLETRPTKFHFGAVGSCITNEQFYRYRHGDLFFYDNPDQNYPFTDDQLAQIRKASFSRILCNNVDIDKVSRNAFFAISGSNPIVDCSSVPVVNICY